MVKILLLEDDSSKCSEIVNVIASFSKDLVQLEIARDVSEAMTFLSKNFYHLFLTDLKVPMRKGSHIQEDAIPNLLSSIEESDSLHSPMVIIGITSFDEMFEKVNPLFSSRIFSILKYSTSSTVWSDRLKKSIQHIVDADGAKDKSVEEYNYDCAIVCALPGVELMGIKSISEDWTPVHFLNDNTFYYETEVQNISGDFKKIIISAASEMGMAASSALVTKMIYRFRPKFLAMVGITGGLKGKTKYGDILIADPSFNYENGKWIENSEGESEFLPDPLQIRLDKEIKSQLQSLSQDSMLHKKIFSDFTGIKPTSPPTSIIGAIGSGSCVIANEGRVDEITKQSRKLIGFEMEIYGALLACQEVAAPRPKALAIKSVCDFGTDHKNDKYQPYAAYTSAQFLLEWIRNYMG